MWRRALTVVIAVLGIHLGLPAEAYACDCHDGGPVCEAFWKTPVVFTGRVESVTPTRGGAAYLVRFGVFEMFRGPIMRTAELITSGSSCDHQFEAGQEWIIYASPRHDGPGLTTSTCARSQLLRNASADIDYIRGAYATRWSDKGRIFGDVMYSKRQGGKPVPGVRVTVNGPWWEPLHAMTDSSGHFDVAAPAGTYRLSAVLPRGMSLRGPDPIVTLLDGRGCATVGFFPDYPATVSGVVVDATGAPVPHVTVEMVEAEQNYDYAPHRVRGLTSASGRFTIPGVEPGLYAAAVLIGRDNGPRYWFTGDTTTRSRAQTFDVDGGAIQDVGKITLPADVKMVQLAGVVQHRDGRPAAKAVVASKVDFDDVDFPWTTIETDSSGRFRLALVPGTRYRIAARPADTDVERRRRLIGEVDYRSEVRTTIEPAAQMPLLRITLKE